MKSKEMYELNELREFKIKPKSINQKINLKLILKNVIR